MAEAARNLRIVDLLSLRPGQVLRLHRVHDRPVLLPSEEKIPDEEVLAEHVPAGQPSLLAGNLSKILECAVETQVVIRHDGGKILQVFLLDPRSWKYLLQETGTQVELRIGGRIFAHGVVQGGEEPGIRISSLVERR
ncbi:MAG TPA: hypothetical protein PLZ55_09805 [bacterium]|nr:hypothetical protein [bacterium]HPO08949.1 hypothetical protein [bacterium]HQP99570.1 hypothetical protein [bacterium]